ncbi:MAG: 2-amino-4-hydroxy-6-hydroxymethyldihydropteridine diphosphokinase [Alphaproteobacteria bacterium]
MEDIIIQRIVLGLGSNLGDREANINYAIDLLVDKNILSKIIVSSIFKNPALLKENSPKEWNIEFYNVAVIGWTSYSPTKLLKKIKEVEILVGRKKREIWAPREIDIDILAYGNKVFQNDELVIPHKDLLNRDFALLPLSEVWPEWKFPVKGKYYNISVNELTKIFLNNK